MTKENEWVTIVAPAIVNPTPTTQVRVEVKQSPPDEKGDTRKGLSVRQWYKPEHLNKYIPTKKGVWIPIQHGFEFVQAVQLVWANYQAKLQETL